MNTEDYNYSLITLAGEVLASSTCDGISETVRALTAETGVHWSYQVIHRALRAGGVWVGYYRPASPTPLVLAVVEKASTANQPTSP